MKNISSIVRLGLVSVVMIIGFNGCSVKIPVNKEVGQLNLKYQIKEKKQKVNKKIAIIAPEFIGRGGSRFNTKLRENYKGRLSKSMSNSFEDLILKKGFTIGGKYKTFDDMTYPERKTTYMALIPTLNIYIDNKVTQEKEYRLYHSEKGVIQISGELTLKMIEPLSKQMFMTKRINLSDFEISKSYIYEVQTRTTNADGFGLGSIISGIRDKASVPDNIKDNTDKVLTEALNEFYEKAMSKIEKYISQEEILAVENDINHAKGTTRSGM